MRYSSHLTSRLTTREAVFKFGKNRIEWGRIERGDKQVRKTETSDTSPEKVLGLVTAPPRAAPSRAVAAQAPSSTADDAEAVAGPDCVMTDRSAFFLDAEGWKKWTEIIDGPPPDDLSGLRAFLTRPAPLVAE